MIFSSKAALFVFCLGASNVFAALLKINADGLIEHASASLANASEQKGFVGNVAEHVPTNKLLSKVRFVAERTFGTLKRTYELSRAKLVGLEKVASEV